VLGCFKICLFVNSLILYDFTPSLFVLAFENREGGVHRLLGRQSKPRFRVMKSCALENWKGSVPLRGRLLFDKETQISTFRVITTVGQRHGVDLPFFVITHVDPVNSVARKENHLTLSFLTCL